MNNPIGIIKKVFGNDKNERLRFRIFRKKIMNFQENNDFQSKQRNGYCVIPKEQNIMIKLRLRNRYR